MKEPVTFACVKWGTLYGPEYANILFDMIRRNMREDQPFRLVCFTDDSTGLDERIEICSLPVGMTGWWNKLYLFSGWFGEDELVIFFDLDTVIIGPVDELANYQGRFAQLEDFYQTTKTASGVMLFRGCHDVWDAYVEAGMPQDLEGGDPVFLERVIPKIDRLQDLYPGMFVSYKAHAQRAIPTDASVVCFHGFPRPHQVDDQWVRDIWTVGGLALSKINLKPNTTDKQLFENITWSSAQDYPWVGVSREHERHAVLCGSGPSLNDSLEEIRWRQSNGQIIFGLNNASNVLSDAGIRVDYQVFLDARPENTRFIDPRAGSYLVASQCARQLFELLKGRRVFLWHPYFVGIDAHLPKTRTAVLIGGGVTVGLSAMALSHTMGYRVIHLFGYDGSDRAGLSHAVAQSKTTQEARKIDIVLNGEIFTGGPAMIGQAHSFAPFADALAEAGATITVHGSGLIPTIARQMQMQRGVH